MRLALRLRFRELAALSGLTLLQLLRLLLMPLLHRLKCRAVLAALLRKGRVLLVLLLRERVALALLPLLNIRLLARRGLLLGARRFRCRCRGSGTRQIPRMRRRRLRTSCLGAICRPLLACRRALADLSGLAVAHRGRVWRAGRARRDDMRGKVAGLRGGRDLRL